MLTARVTDLAQRVASLSLRDGLMAVGVASLCVAIAWIGWHVGRLLDSLDALRERVRAVEGNAINAEDRVARVDDHLSSRMRNLELRQDRLQSSVEAQRLGWRDSALQTEQRDSGFTMVDLRKP